MNSTEFHGKIALISGAGSGIGYELALELANQGATIIGTDIQQDRINSLVDDLKKKGKNVSGYVVDHTDKQQVDDFSKQILEKYGRVDILCCNAGVASSSPVVDTPMKDWQWVTGINYWGQVYLINQFVPQMKNRKEGWVLITASLAGLVPFAGMSVYCATKAAMVFLANIMQMELRQYNIKVSALCPGVINTNIVKDGKIPGDKNKELAMKIYSKFGTHPSKVAKTGIKGLKKNKAIIRVPLHHAILLHFLYRFCPSLLLRIGSFLFNRGWTFIGPLMKS